MKTQILPFGDVNFGNSRPYRKNPQAALKEDCAHRWSRHQLRILYANVREERANRLLNNSLSERH
jgi:hypothetical protein